jgi:multiple sugar transport system ATP-binding protein
MAAISLEGISKRFEDATTLAVDNLSLTISDGEFMVLLGPSGCGKSTVLRMVAGLETMSAGRLTIDGRDMTRVPAKDRDIAMVFQSYALYPHMNVHDNLAFGVRRRGLPKEETERRIAEVVATLGLSELLHRRPHALSGGQRQRVALGRAMVRKPRVFLLDEPLSNLDAGLRTTMRNELIQLHNRLRATMIYVTHDQVEAMSMATTMCVMREGRAVQIGAPLAIYRHPVDTFVARFLGNPPMNLLPGIVERQGDEVTVRIADALVRLRGWRPDDVAGYFGRRIQVGIRPEDLHEQAPHTVTDGSLSTRVVAVEPLGAETILVLSLPGRNSELTARVSWDSPARVGDLLAVGFDQAALRFFDAEDGRAIQDLAVAASASPKHAAG